MELIFILAVLIGTNSELNNANEEITYLQAEVNELEVRLEDVEATTLNTAVAHSAFVANQRIRTDRVEDQIEGVLDILISAEPASEVE